jgi:hypothetical protein
MSSTTAAATATTGRQTRVDGTVADAPPASCAAPPVALAAAPPVALAVVAAAAPPDRDARSEGSRPGVPPKTRSTSAEAPTASQVQAMSRGTAR